MTRLASLLIQYLLLRRRRNFFGLPVRVPGRFNSLLRHWAGSGVALRPTGPDVLQLAWKARRVGACGEQQQRGAGPVSAHQRCQIQKIYGLRTRCPSGHGVLTGEGIFPFLLI